MKNKVTVTRANRLNLVKYKDYAVLSNVSKYLIEADGTVAVVNNEGNAIYIEARRMHSHLWGTYDMVYPMDNFEDVAKWVANGRKLEDLQGDTKNEWEQLRTLELGDFFMEAGKTYQIQNFGLAKDCTTIECWCLDDSSMVEFNNERLAWPVRFDLGDTITFGKITE